MSQEQDKSFFRNFSLIVGGLAIMMVLFIFAARFIGIDEKAQAKRSEAEAAKLTAPMGDVSVSEPAATPTPAQETAMEPATDASPAMAGDTGKQVYDSLCTSCHSTGIPGIPQYGDKAAWEPRIAQGKDTLYQHAIQGFTGASGMMMPPKGGGTGSDDEVKAAVDYMVAAVESGMAAIAAAASTDASAETPAAIDGKKVYNGLCTSCHGTGLPGIPQLGDKAAWAPRIAQGKDTLYQNAIKGFTGKSGMMMPPKGGGANTDDEVKAAVDYMVTNSQ